MCLQVISPWFKSPSLDTAVNVIINQILSEVLDME